MGIQTAIAWCDHTFNPWRGCTRVSDGCRHCYADRMSSRNPGILGVWGPKGRRVIAAESMWEQPLRWDSAAARAGVRRRVFCASMADVFEGSATIPVTDWPLVTAARGRLWALIERTPNLDWLLLTKRPELVMALIPHRWALDGLPPHVWLGVSVEHQAAADARVPVLLGIPARVRFLSCEPLLRPIDLLRMPRAGEMWDWLTGERSDCRRQTHTAAISWVIVGGETGPHARPMHPDWARSLRDQCHTAGTPFFFKQWGAWRPCDQACADGRSATRWVSRTSGETYMQAVPDAALMFDTRHGGSRADASEDHILDGLSHEAYPTQQVSTNEQGGPHAQIR